MVPESEKKGPDGHFDLMENRDGHYDESRCETWISSGPRESKSDVCTYYRYSNACSIMANSHWHEGFYCDIEWDEWMLANAFVQPGDVVVEFGARFGKSSIFHLSFNCWAGAGFPTQTILTLLAFKLTGTTSCVLSRNVGKHGEVISVEPDVTVQ